MFLYENHSLQNVPQAKQVTESNQGYVMLPFDLKVSETIFFFLKS